MKKDKSQWLKEIEHSLDHVERKNLADPQFKVQLTHLLNQVDSSVKKLPPLTVLAAAASFTLLVMANIWLYTPQQDQEQEGIDKAYNEVIDEYNFIPPSFTNIYSL